MENTLAPCRAVQSLTARRVLVFAPHPDDEVFGCGGALCQYTAAGTAVRVIVATDGGEAPPAEMTRAEYVALRKEESQQAARLIGYPDPLFWPFADRALRYGEKLVQECLAAIVDWQADLVFAPSLHEIHPDHRALAMCVLEAARRQGGCQVAWYEIGQPLPHPNVLLDIGAQKDRKRAAMTCFVSQLDRQDYSRQIEALNLYRTFRAQGLAAVEAFMLMSPAELTGRDPFGLFRSEHARQAALGLPADATNAPLVSIIVRSMDRPTLDDALDSIALQTYPNVEVVLVNAKGQGHRDMPPWCGRFPLRVAGGTESLSRSRAANVGLDAAQGAYLIFLDDDDLFDADHVAILTDRLLTTDTALAAYAGVRMLDHDGHELQVVNRPFSKERLFFANYLPIHAVLFSHLLVTEHGCRFDENLAVFEDWDFWLQLTRVTTFSHVDRISAAYRVALGGSGLAGPQGIKVQQEGRRRMFEKWLRLWTGEEFDQLAIAAENDRHAAETDLSNLRQQIDESALRLRREMASCSQERDAAKAAIAALYQSTSWRITRPLRAMRRVVRFGWN